MKISSSFSLISAVLPTEPNSILAFSISVSSTFSFEEIAVTPCIILAGVFGIALIILADEPMMDSIFFIFTPAAIDITRLFFSIIVSLISDNTVSMTLGFTAKIIKLDSSKTF